MDMNLHAIRDAGGQPRVVLYQHDKEDAMNPRGLLIAYQEDVVTPVVSDFDPFTFGSRSMNYDPIAKEQVEVLKWSLEGIRKVLDEDLCLPVINRSSWTSCWLSLLKYDRFHPHVPPLGFGDPTTYRIVSRTVEVTSSCGAVRHGAECFNFYFPQEMDPEYLVVWDGFGEEGWQYQTEDELQNFLLARVSEGYAFPLNPAWVLRDPSWMDIFNKLRKSPAAQGPLSAWYPPESGIMERIDKIAEEFPRGFAANNKVMRKFKEKFGKQEMTAEEMADKAMLELRRYEVLRRAKTKLRTMFILSRLLGEQRSKNRASRGSFGTFTMNMADMSKANALKRHTILDVRRSRLHH